MNTLSKAISLAILLGLALVMGCGENGEPSGQAEQATAEHQHPTYEPPTEPAVGGEQEPPTKHRSPPTEAEAKQAIAVACAERFPQWNTLIDIENIGPYDEAQAAWKVETDVAVAVPGTLMSLPVEYARVHRNGNGIWAAELVERKAKDSAPGAGPFTSNRTTPAVVPEAFTGKWTLRPVEGDKPVVMSISGSRIVWQRSGEDSMAFEGNAISVSEDKEELVLRCNIAVAEGTFFPSSRIALAGR